MPDPICIRSGSAGKHLPEAGGWFLHKWLASGPDPFGQNLTLSARTKSDPGWICTILSGTSVEERNRVWKWETVSGPVASCQKPGPMIPVHQLVYRPDVFGQTLTRPSRSDPVPNMIQAFFGKTELKLDSGSRMWHLRSGPILAARWP